MSNFNFVRSIIPLAAFVVLAFAAPLDARIHVSATGDDVTGTGTASRPFQTLQRAFQSSDNEILMEGGQYVLPPGLVIPPGKNIRGGHKVITFGDGQPGFAPDGSSPTFLLVVGTPGQPGITVSGGATISWALVIGGFFSMELLPGATIREIDFLGAESSAVLVAQSGAGGPANVDSCRVHGGGGGFRVDGTGSLNLTRTLIRNTRGAGLRITGTGFVGAANNVFQQIQGPGVSIAGNSNVILQNNVLRRNSGIGIDVANANPIIRGCFLEFNDDGIRLLRSPSATIQNNTIVRNRGNGIVLRESEADMRYNIVALNSRFGVFEDKPDPTTVLENGEVVITPAPTHGGDFERNFLWQNVLGQYYDERETALNDTESLNADMINVGNVEGNLVADPKFANFDRGNFRLAEDSPAIDYASSTETFLKDLDGNEREVDLSGGLQETELVDAGAWERQTHLIRNLGTEFGDFSSEPDTWKPGGFANIMEGPEWRHKDELIHNYASVAFLPGRIRMQSLQDASYAGLVREALDVAQPADKINVIKSRIAGFNSTGNPMLRFRTNGPEALDLSINIMFNNNTVVGPGNGVAEYLNIYDYRQGGYREVSRTAPYPSAYWVDLIDFQNLPIRNPQDLLGIEVLEFDRQEFEGQFNREVARWTFDTGTEGWKTTFVAGGIFNNPRLLYNPSKRALEFQQTQHNSFASWESPGTLLPLGTRYRVDARISTPQPVAQSVGFRMRLTTERFEVVNELILLPFAGSIGAPTPDGRDFTIYSYIPESLINSESGQSGSAQTFVAFDLWGFDFDGRSPFTNLYIEDVRITVADEPIF